MKNRPRIFIWRRVDMQVSALSMVVAIVSASLVFFFSYTTTYRDMIYALRERVNSISTFLDGALDTTTFVDINSAEDMEKPSYLAMKELFKAIKMSTGVQYLYTAKRADDGQLVYVIDGLERSAPDFRCPGDPIEPEIVDVLNRALLGESILPKNIVKTDWGDIFITYLPIYGEDNNVVGVIGIEFAATHQYETYRMLRYATPFIIFFICLLSAFFSVRLFRRISNPHFQDMANTDTHTQLKNRNAYELDTKNACALHTAKGSCLMLIDLNGLKNVNDTLGHDVGDLYIRAMADSLRETCNEQTIAYRIGGDEFMVILKRADERQIADFSLRLQKVFKSHIPAQIPHASYSMGWKFCGDNTIEAINEAYSGADAMMYAEKQKHYARISKGDL